MRLAALEIPAQPEYVSIARLVVSTVAGDRYEFTDDQLESLKLAVSEACVVAIQSQGPDSSNAVQLWCDGSDDKVAVSVGCEGADFGSSSGDDFATEFGLPMIGSLVDEYVVEEAEGRSMLRMTLSGQLAEQL